MTRTLALAVLVCLSGSRPGVGVSAYRTTRIVEPPDLEAPWATGVRVLCPVCRHWMHSLIEAKDHLHGRHDRRDGHRCNPDGTCEG